MAALIAYLRVPGHGEAEEPASIEVQRVTIEQWARQRRHRLVETIEDPSAESLEDRHGLAEVLAQLRTGVAQGVVLYGLECLDGNLVAQEQLLAEIRTAGGRVYSANQSEALQLRRVPADPARQLVRDALRTAAANGPQVAALRSRRRLRSRPGAGSPPYGYRIEGGDLVPDPDEQASLIRIAELRASGATLREMANELDNGGHRPKRAARWHPETLRRIVERLDQ
jgi:DNA invertase Pin-like site-specific DNA recombinase